MGASSRDRLYGEAVDLTGRSSRWPHPDPARQLAQPASRDTSVQAEVEGKLQTGGLRHTVLAGVESWRFHGAGHSLLHPGQPAFAIDIHNPTYGQAPGNLTPGFDTRDRQRARACSSTRWPERALEAAGCVRLPLRQDYKTA